MPEPEPMDWEEAEAYEKEPLKGPRPRLEEIKHQGHVEVRRAIALARQEKERAEMAIADLAECYRQSGADTDGNEDWRLAKRAVAEVKRLRKDSDYSDVALDLADKLAEAVGKLPITSGPVWDALRAYREGVK